MAQPIRTPDIEAQRAAMKKLDFLIGQWAGEASVLRGPGQWVEMIQTEEAQHKLDGVVLLIEGVGRAKSEVMPDGKPVLQALGMVSFDDETETYRMRAFNDGRFLETEVTLVADNAIAWGFTLGEIKTNSVLRIDDKGDWTELGELTMGARPAVKFLELCVSR
jgi:hypothetical protein